MPPANWMAGVIKLAASGRSRHQREPKDFLWLCASPPSTYGVLDGPFESARRISRPADPEGRVVSL